MELVTPHKGGQLHTRFVQNFCLRFNGLRS